MPLSLPSFDCFIPVACLIYDAPSVQSVWRALIAGHSASGGYLSLPKVTNWRRAASSVALHDFLAFLTSREFCQEEILLQMETSVESLVAWCFSALQPKILTLRNDKSV